MSKSFRKGIIWMVRPDDSFCPRSQKFNRALPPPGLAQLGQHQSAKWEVMGSNNGRTNNQGLQKTGEIMLICWLWFETLSQFRRSRHCAVTISRWPCLLHPSVIGQSEGGVKEPTLLFEKSRGNFPSGVDYLSRITHHSYHGLWVGYSKLMDGLTAAATGALVCWSPSFNVFL